MPDNIPRRLTRDERHSIVIGYMMPAFVFIIVPIVIMTGALLLDERGLYAFCRDSIMRNPWYMLPAFAISVPTLAWAVKLLILEDIKEDAMRRKFDDLLLKFAPDHYVRMEVPAWVRVGVILVFLVAIGFIGYVVLFHRP